MFIRVLRGQQGIIYNGPLTAPYFIKFLSIVMQPLQRINSNRDLINLVQKQDVSLELLN